MARATHTLLLPLWFLCLLLRSLLLLLLLLQTHPLPLAHGLGLLCAAAADALQGAGQGLPGLQRGSTAVATCRLCPNDMAVFGCATGLGGPNNPPALVWPHSSHQAVSCTASAHTAATRQQAVPHQHTQQPPGSKLHCISTHIHVCEQHEHVASFQCMLLQPGQPCNALACAWFLFWGLACLQPVAIL